MQATAAVACSLRRKSCRPTPPAWHLRQAADRAVAVCDDDHAFLPDDFLVAGKGVTIRYEPDAVERELLGYQGGDLAATLRAMVAAVDALPPRG